MHACMHGPIIHVQPFCHFKLSYYLQKIAKTPITLKFEPASAKWGNLNLIQLPPNSKEFIWVYLEMVVTKFKIPSGLLPLSTTICRCTPWYWATCMFVKVMDMWKWTWWKLWPSKFPIHLTFATCLWLYKVHLLNNSHLSLNHNVVICMKVWKWMWRCNFGTMVWNCETNLILIIALPPLNKNVCYIFMNMAYPLLRKFENVL